MVALEVAAAVLVVVVVYIYIYKGPWLSLFRTYDTNQHLFHLFNFRISFVADILLSVVAPKHMNMPSWSNL